MKANNKNFKSIYNTKLTENLEKYDLKLKQKKYDDEPTKKLDDVNEILENNNIKRKIHDEKTLDQLKDVAKKSISLMNSKPLSQIESILDILIDVDINYLKDDNEVKQFEEVLKEINKLTFQIKKML